MKRPLCTVIVTSVLVGCASTYTPRVTNMVAAGPVARVDGHRIAVGGVTGGRNTSFWTIAHVSNADLHSALVRSLTGLGMYDAAGRYRLSARILKEEGSGRNEGVELRVAYEMTDIRDASFVWREDVTSVASVHIGEVFVGMERWRRVLELATRRNIGQFLDRLVPALERRAGAERPR